MLVAIEICYSLYFAVSMLGNGKVMSRCLDVQVDLELARLPPGRMDQINSFGDLIDGSSVHSDGTIQPSGGPENWPVQVLNQQP